MERYKALALQVTCKAVNKAKNKEAAESIMLESLNRLEAQIRASKAFIGPDTKLVVLPEYFLTGFPMGESLKKWQAKACLAKDGKIYDAIVEKEQIIR